MLTDNIQLLPVDILVNIFKRLNIKDLHNVMLSCKIFYDLIKNDNTIWRPLARNRLMIDLSDSSKSNELWFYRCRTSHNWCKGYYQSKVVINHYTNYMPWLTFHKSEILLVSVGSELHCYPTNRKGFPNCREALWKVDVPKIQRQDVRTHDISRFVIKNNYIISGNRDGCLAVYIANNPRKRPWLQYHIQDCHGNGQKEVTAVEVLDSRNQIMVVTGSYVSNDLRFCSFSKEDNSNTTYILRGDEPNIKSISFYENAGTKCLALSESSDKLAIGLNGNSKPLVLDVYTPQFLMTADATKNPKQQIRDIRWHDENTILYVTHSGVLEMIDVRAREVVYNSKDPFQSSFYCVKSDGQWGIVAGSAEYSRCVLFDTRNQMNHVQMYFTQKKTSPVYSLDFDPYRLITAVDRGVAVLNFNITAASEQQKDYSHIFY
ncbi:hypothetical protein PYW08_008698 [Mythimna loreyi]|uniref:Uncharacterized protein n=1 Tax=Mythimna loreyi TaxID=667449 RepID=A0ACC2QB62_9NEOP|nr:hypothetical protein PYW08_008698 [Mythimna loreyi]